MLAEELSSAELSNKWCYGGLVIVVGMYELLRLDAVVE